MQASSPHAMGALTGGASRCCVAARSRPELPGRRTSPVASVGSGVQSVSSTPPRAAPSCPLRARTVAPRRRVGAPSPPQALSLDPGALSSACTTTYKLVLLCAVVSKLLKVNMLPKETPVVLSKVAFNLLLPCMLCSKVAVTLGEVQSLAMLSIPIVGLMQIFAGIFAGAVLYKGYEILFERKLAKQPAVALAGGSVAAADGAAAGTSVSGGSGGSDNSDVLKSIVKAASGFGNSITLPLIFFSTLLPGAQYDRAAGYTAMFLIGWSPALWSLGYKMFVASEDDASGAEAPSSPLAAAWQSVVSLKKYLNPPMWGVIAGVVIGLSPLANVFFPSKEFMGALPTIGKILVSLPKGAMELIGLMGSSTLAVQTLVLAASLIPADEDKKVDMRELLMPASKQEIGVLFITMLVRFVVTPLVGLGLLLLFRNLSWLPEDPICYLVLLVQAVMPSAQNLVLLMQLQASTRPLAPLMAKLLLQIYLLAVIPLALWMGALLPIIGLQL